MSPIEGPGLLLLAGSRGDERAVVDEAGRAPYPGSRGGPAALAWVLDVLWARGIGHRP